MKKLTDVIHEQSKYLREVANDMRRFSTAFKLTGNTEFAQDLIIMANTIDEVQETISKQLGDSLHDMVQESNKAIGETFKAILESIPETEEDSCG